MHEHPGVDTCRWSRLTLRLPYPFRLDSDNKPWSCLRDVEPRPLDDPAICRDCPHWQPRRLAIVHG